VEDVLVPRRFSLLVAIFSALVLLASLSVGTVSAAPGPGAHIFVFDLTPEAEEPEVGDVGASGVAAILVVPAADLICYRLTWQDIEGSVVGAHIHEAPVGVDNPAPLVGLIAGTFSGATGRYQACTRSAEADAIAENPENYYVNIHSTVFPGGAIRGQLA
jgi:CHRD domain-containing protein